MEKIAEQDQIHKRIESKSKDLAAKHKSSAPTPQIDSMVVDIRVPLMDNQTGNCHHFCIRGYVAEMREKNRKTCELFTSCTSQNNLEQLPPLIVSKHRYWRCEGCLPETCTGYPNKDGNVASKCWQNGLVSDATCIGMPFFGGAARTSAEMDQSAVTKMNSQSKVQIDALLPRTNADICASSSSHGKEINSHTREMALTCCELRASSSTPSKEKSADIREMPLTGDENGCGNVKNQKNHGEPHFPLQLNHNKMVHQMDQNITASEILKCIGGISADTCLHNKRNTAKGQPEAVQASRICSYNTTIEPVRAGDVHLTRSPSFQVEERDAASSDSEGILAGCIDLHQLNDELNGLPRRKTRKVRLLADLLNEKGSLEIDRIGKDNTSFSGTATVSTGLWSAIAQEAQSQHEDIEKAKQSPPRKRKMSHLEDSCSLEIRGSANASKKVRLSRISSERPYMTNEVSNSGSEESHPSKHKNDRPLSLFKKKMLIQVDSEVGNHVAIGDSEQSVALLDTSNVCSTTCRRPEMIKCFNLFKGKRPEVDNDDMSSSPANYSTLGEVPIRTNQTDMQRVSGRIQLQSESNLSSKVCLDLSLGRLLRTEGHAKDKFCKTNPALLQPKNRRGRYPHSKNKNVVEQLSVLNNTSSSQSVRKRLTLDPEGRIAYSSDITLEKQNSSCFSEKRGFTLQERVDGKGKTEEVHGHMEASVRQNDQRADKAFEKGSSDDMPTEIVELMAKNQYERQMVGEGQSLSKRSDCTNGVPVSVDGNCPMQWLQAQTPGLMNISHANATNGIAVAVDNRVTTKGNAINLPNADEWHFNLSHLAGDQVKFFYKFSENQKQSSEMQYPVSGPSTTVSKPNEGARPVWSFKNKDIPFDLSIPQKYTTLSNSVEAYAHCGAMQHQGRTISDIRSEEMRMPNESQLILSRPRRGKLHPKPRGSLDPYFNKMIPAMQLLSLMHKGMLSNAACNVDANRFHAIPLSSCDYHSKLSADERHYVWDRSFYLRQHQMNGVYCAGKTSSRPSSSLSSQMSFGSQKMEQLGVTKFQKSFPRSGGLLNPCPRKDKPHRKKLNRVLGTSNFPKIPLQCRRLENNSRIIDLGANSVSGTSLSSKGTPGDGPCSFNQNPAEFSIPEPGNKYTISGKDLKILKRCYYQQRSYTVKVDSQKRQRPTKVSTGKKHAGCKAS